MLVVIPARGGSQRLPGKALKDLGGKPLLAWAIESALTMGDYARVVVASEDADILRAAAAYPECERWRRPMSTASDDAPDLTWLTLALAQFPGVDTFMVRRPTSPFIRPATMERAWEDFLAVPKATAMRAMRPVTEHPNKQWVRDGVWMQPLMPGNNSFCGIEPWSMPTQTLRRVYVQTAGLEIIRRSTLQAGSLTGEHLLALELTGPEALDINTPADWEEAERVCQTMQRGHRSSFVAGTRGAAPPATASSGGSGGSSDRVTSSSPAKGTTRRRS